MKKILNTLPLLVLLIVVSSCSSIKVAADYDKNANFNEYKTFAFFKTGIDKAEISDLDKRRILRAIEAELLSKGFTKSESPDLLISLFTKSQQRVDVYNNSWGWGGWGWGGWGWGGHGLGWGGWGWGGDGPGWGWGWNQPSVSTSTEGTLYIDLIDTNKKELVWQGMGTGYLSRNIEKKDERIKEFVSEIMMKYPPEAQQ